MNTTINFTSLKTYCQERGIDAREIIGNISCRTAIKSHTLTKTRSVTRHVITHPRDTRGNTKMEIEVDDNGSIQWIGIPGLSIIGDPV